MSPAVIAIPVLIWLAMDGFGAPIIRRNAANDLVTRELEIEADQQLLHWRIALEGAKDPNRTYVLGDPFETVLPAPGRGVASLPNLKKTDSNC